MLKRPGIAGFAAALMVFAPDPAAAKSTSDGHTLLVGPSAALQLRRRITASPSSKSGRK